LKPTLLKKGLVACAVALITAPSALAQVTDDPHNLPPPPEATLNAAPAYVVNDIYKRFINPNAGGRKEVALSRIVILNCSRYVVQPSQPATCSSNRARWSAGIEPSR